MTERVVATQSDLDDALADGSVTRVVIDSPAGVWLEVGGSSSVVAWGSSRVDAGAYVAVHLHSTAATVHGGVVIDLSRLDPRDTATWLAYCGAAVHDDTVTLYKAVDADLRPGHSNGGSIVYTPGAEVVAPDWRDDHECGGGLHVSPSPTHAEANSVGDVSRFLAVRVRVDDIRSIGWDKCKVPKLTVLHEVDRWGDPIGDDQ